MKNICKVFITFLTFMMILGGIGFNNVMADDTTGMDGDYGNGNPLSPVSDNTGSAAFSTLEVDQQYGQTPVSGDAIVIDSLFSSDTIADFGKGMNLVMGFTPVSQSNVNTVLKAVEDYVNAGGLSAQAGSFTTLETDIGLQDNDTDSVQLISGSANSSAWIYVIDENAVCFIIQDENGNGIPNALVTISYIDSNNQRVTRSVKTTNNAFPGIAAFSDIDENTYGIVDVVADGYHSIAVLDKELIGGSKTTYILNKSKTNELYIRGVDLGGKDLVNEDTKISLVKSGSSNLDLKIMVSSCGTATLPAFVNLTAKNRDTLITTILHKSQYSLNSDTAIFTMNADWISQNSGLLKEADQLTIEFGEYTYDLSAVKVINAILDPGVEEGTVPMNNVAQDANLSDALGSSGFLDGVLNIIDVPITASVFPDGSFTIMASYDLMNILNKSGQDSASYDSLFKDTWDPKKLKGVKSLFEPFKEDFWTNTEKVKKGEAILNSNNKLKCVSQFHYDLTMDFSLFLSGTYNETYSYYDGDAGFAFFTNFTAGVTEYFLIPAGAIIIPAFVGFEGNVGISSGLHVLFDLTNPVPDSAGGKIDVSMHHKDPDVNARIEVLAGAKVFAGVGLKDFLAVFMRPVL